MSESFVPRRRILRFVLGFETRNSRPPVPSFFRDEANVSKVGACWQAILARGMSLIACQQAYNNYAFVRSWDVRA